MKGDMICGAKPSRVTFQSDFGRSYRQPTNRDSTSIDSGCDLLLISAAMQDIYQLSEQISFGKRGDDP
jgi:hypothetical protein